MADSSAVKVKILELVKANHLALGNKTRALGVILVALALKRNRIRVASENLEIHKTMEVCLASHRVDLTKSRALALLEHPAPKASLLRVRALVVHPAPKASLLRVRALVE